MQKFRKLLKEKVERAVFVLLAGILIILSFLTTIEVTSKKVFAKGEDCKTFCYWTVTGVVCYTTYCSNCEITTCIEY